MKIAVRRYKGRSKPRGRSPFAALRIWMDPAYEIGKCSSHLLANVYRKPISIVLTGNGSDCRTHVRDRVGDGVGGLEPPNPHRDRKKP